MKPTPLSCLVLTLVVAVCAGQEPPSGELDAMSLQDLLQIQVVTPAAKGQTAAESPAVVSVLTAEQIRDLGVTSLYEALGYLPGVQVVETYFGYSAVNVRGLLQSHYNNKVLLLVNGHPLREVVNGSFHLEVVPVEAVERIELVRGPGSALYGTNAFAGVVNLITRTGSDPGARLVAAGGGTFDTVEASAGWGTHEGDLDVAATASYRTDNGYPYRVEQDERGQAGTLDYYDEFGNAFAHLAYRGLTVEAAAFSQEKQKFGITPVLDYNGRNEFEGGFLDLRWDRELKAGLDLEARLRYDTIDRTQYIGHFPYDGFEGHADSSTVMESSGWLWGGEVSLSYAPSSRVSLLGGVVYEERETDPYLFRFLDDGSIHPYTAYHDSHDASNTAVYGQALLGIAPRTDAVVGFRYDDDSDAGDALLPRLGLVHRLGDSLYLKLLYAEAYRTPDFFEKYVSTYNVLFGDAGLDRERTRSLDVALDATLGGAYNLQVDAFVLRTSDVVTRVPTSRPDITGPGASEYVNAEGDQIWGLEAAFIAQPAAGLRAFASLAYLEGESRATDAELTDFANYTATAGVSLRLGPALAVKPNAQYVGSRGEVDDYLLLNLVVSFPVAADWSVDLIGRNLTEATYDYPEYVRGILDAIPGGPESSYLARVRWQY